LFDDNARFIQKCSIWLNVEAIYNSKHFIAFILDIQGIQGKRLTTCSAFRCKYHAGKFTTLLTSLTYAWNYEWL